MVRKKTVEELFEKKCVRSFPSAKGKMPPFSEEQLHDPIKKVYCYISSCKHYKKGLCVKDVIKLVRDDIVELIGKGSGRKEEYFETMSCRDYMPIQELKD